MEAKYCETVSEQSQRQPIITTQNPTVVRNNNNIYETAETDPFQSGRRFNSGVQLKERRPPKLAAAGLAAVVAVVVIILIAGAGDSESVAGAHEYCILRSPENAQTHSGCCT